MAAAVQASYRGRHDGVAITAPNPRHAAQFGGDGGGFGGGDGGGGGGGGP